MQSMATTADWLRAAGLGTLETRVGHLSLSQLRSLLISDYDRHGIKDMREKQRLFRALNDLRPANYADAAPSPPQQLTPQPSGGDR